MATKRQTEREVPAVRVTTVTIPAPNLRGAVFTIRGTEPYVQHAFSAKGRQIIHDQQAAGSTTAKGKKRDPKNFEEAYEGAMHKSTEGWCGIPAPNFRNSMISACKLCGFAMTRAKLSIFIKADGYDVVDQTPLVKITKGEPEYLESVVRNATGVVDLRARPLWRPTWEARVRIRYDADQFTLMDVTNLLMRVGMQAGIGEGRPDSKDSCGMGWGLFEIINQSDAA